MVLKSNQLYKIPLEKEKETLLITLYAKTLDSQLKNSILNDQKAAEILAVIDYDFEKLNSFGNGNTMVVRAKQMDTWVEEFLKTHPEANVLNLGCGLDTRISRINPSSNVNWFDVDYPEVIEVRKLFYSNREGYEMVPSSLNQLNWLDRIPRDKPVMIIAEGVLEYLTEDEVKTLLNGLSDYFLHGQIAFDVMNTFAINSSKEILEKTIGAQHKWAVDNVQDVDKLDQKLTRIANLSVIESKYMKKLSLKFRLIYTLMYLIPSFRNMIRLLLYKF